MRAHTLQYKGRVHAGKAERASMHTFPHITHAYTHAHFNTIYMIGQADADRVL